MISEKRMLIYFDELVMTLAKQYGQTMDTHIYSPRDILSSMQGLRPVDAVEVVHGRWIGYSYDISCSHCGVYQTYLTGRTNYCPNCGAKMDEEVT